MSFLKFLRILQIILFTLQVCAMTMLVIILASSCSERQFINSLRVKYVVTYNNNVWEAVEASPHAVLKESGCFVDQGQVLRCYVRKIERVPIKEY